MMAWSHRTTMHAHQKRQGFFLRILPYYVLLHCLTWCLWSIASYGRVIAHHCTDYGARAGSGFSSSSSDLINKAGLTSSSGLPACLSLVLFKGLATCFVMSQWASVETCPHQISNSPELSNSSQIKQERHPPPPRKHTQMGDHYWC